MQESNGRMHTRGRRWRRQLRLLLAVLPLGFLWSAMDVAAATGVLMQRLGTEGCVSEDGTMGACTDGHELFGAGSVAVSPDGRHVYVASFNSSAVTTFMRNLATGALGQLNGIAGCVSEIGDGVTCGKGRGLNGAVSVAVSPDGQHVYVASRDGNAVAIFRRETTTGVLTQLSGLAGCIAANGNSVTCTGGTALLGLRTVTVSPDGKSVYLGARDSDAVAVLARDPATGALTQPSGPTGCVSETGTGGFCLDGRGLLGARGVAVSPDSKHVYVAAQNSNAVVVFGRDTTTGVLTQLPGLAGCIALNGDGVTCAPGRGLRSPIHAEVSLDGQHVYVASRDSNAVAIFRRDTTTGALTQLLGLAGCIAENGDGGNCTVGAGLREAVFLTVSLDGTNLYVTSQVSDAVATFSRDTVTGALTQLPGLDGCVSEDGSDDGKASVCADGKGLLGAIAVTVSLDGLNVYTASYISNALAIFNRK